MNKWVDTYANISNINPNDPIFDNKLWNQSYNKPDKMEIVTSMMFHLKKTIWTLKMDKTSFVDEISMEFIHAGDDELTNLTISIFDEMSNNMGM